MLTARALVRIDWLQFPLATTHHWEVVSRGGHQAFVRPFNGCADGDASVAGPSPADRLVRRVALALGQQNWTALPTWLPLDGHAPPLTELVIRPPRMGTRQTSPSYTNLLRGEPPNIIISILVESNCCMTTNKLQDSVLLHFCVLLGP